MLETGDKEMFRKAFTLIEAIVVLLLLAIIGSMSMPTFQNVLDKSQNKTDEINFSTFLTSVMSHNLLKAKTFLPELVNQGVEQAGEPWVQTENINNYGDVQIVLSPTGETLQAVTISRDGETCLWGQVEIGTVKVQSKPVGECDNFNPEPEPSEPDPTSLPPAVTALEAELNGTELILNWNKDPNAEKYLLMRNDEKIAETTKTSWKLNQPYGSANYYQIISVKGSNETMGETLTVKNAPHKVPLQTKSLTAAVELAWEVNPSNEWTYQIAVADNPQMTNSTIVYDGRTSPQKIIASPLLSRYYQLAVKTPGGDTKSDPALGVAFEASPEQIVVTGQHINGKNKLTWSANAARYEIRKNQNLVATLPANTTSWEETTPPGVTTSYTVTGYNSRGSSTASVNVLAAPHAPLLTGKAALLSVNLSWDAVPGATSYQVRRSTLSSNMAGSILVYDGNNTQFTNVSLTAGLLYHYTVTATNASGSATSSPISVWPLIGGLLG